MWLSIVHEDLSFFLDTKNKQEANTPPGDADAPLTAKLESTRGAETQHQTTVQPDCGDG